MKITRHAQDFEISFYFPDATKLHVGEGECVYASEVGGKFFLIMDSGTLLDGLDEQDRNDFLSIAIVVYEFLSHAERSEYLQSRNIRENVRAR